MDGWAESSGWDPSLVDAESIRSLAVDLQHSAGVASDAAAEATGALLWVTWSGRAAEEAAELAGLLRWALGTVAAGLRTAAVALLTYASDIEDIAARAVAGARDLAVARDRYLQVLHGPAAGEVFLAEADFRQAMARTRALEAEADAAASQLAATAQILLDPEAGAWARTTAERLERVSTGARLVSAVPAPAVREGAVAVAGASAGAAMVLRSWLALRDMGRWSEVPVSLAASAIPRAPSRSPESRRSDLVGETVPPLDLPVGQLSGHRPPLVVQAEEARKLPQRMTRLQLLGQSLAIPPPAAHGRPSSVPVPGGPRRVP